MDDETKPASATLHSSDRILGLEIHPDASLFPLTEGGEFETLKASIAKHGLLEPIRLHEGKILDGRNRARALQAIGAVSQGTPDGGCLFYTKAGLLGLAHPAELRGRTPAEYVAAANVERRHLTRAQRRALAGTLALRIEEEQRAKAKREKVDSLAKAAKVAGVSRRTAASAKAEAIGKPKPVREVVVASPRPVACYPVPTPAPLRAPYDDEDGEPRRPTRKAVAVLQAQRNLDVTLKRIDAKHAPGESWSSGNWQRSEDVPPAGPVDFRGEIDERLNLIESLSDWVEASEADLTSGDCILLLGRLDELRRVVQATRKRVEAREDETLRARRARAVHPDGTVEQNGDRASP